MMEPVPEAIRQVGEFSKRDPPAFAVFNSQLIGPALGGSMQEFVDKHDLVLQLGTDQLFDVGNGVEVIDRCVMRFNLDLIPFLEKQDQTDRGERVEDPPGKERG
jgi:hypothetical protein